MIAPRISLEAELESRTEAALRGISNSAKAALRNGDVVRRAEYDKMRDYLSDGRYFDAAYVAQRLGEGQRARDLKGLMHFSHMIKEPAQSTLE